MASFANTLAGATRRSRADEQLGADLRVGVPVARRAARSAPPEAVSASRVSTVRLRTVSPVASSSRRARSANASAPMRLNMLVGGAQLLARVDAPVLAAQPFAVEQVGARQLDARRGCGRAARSPRGRALGGLAVAQQRARAASMPSAQSVPLAACSLREARRARRPRELGLRRCGRPPRPARRSAQRGPEVVGCSRPRSARRQRLARSGRGRCRAPPSRTAASDRHALAARDASCQLGLDQLAPRPRRPRHAASTSAA